MPKIFKALATVVVWTLFIAGGVGVLVALRMDIVRAPGSTGVWAVSIMALISSVVAMKLRQSIDK